jgi:superoxide reductase
MEGIMTELKEQWQSGEWKSEKHVPVIDCPDAFKKSETICATITVGKEIPHPNTAAHHIQWIDLYFLPEGEKFSYQVGRFECTAHGASIQGPDTSTIYTNPVVSIEFKTDKSGTIMAASYCNIHGLWQSSKKIHLQK